MNLKENLHLILKVFTKHFPCVHLKDIIAQGLDVHTPGPDSLDLSLSCMTLGRLLNLSVH